MKRDIIFWSSKRFKLEEIEKKDFRPDGSSKWPKAKADNLNSEHNLRSRVKENQNLSTLFLERQKVNKQLLHGLPII